MKNDYKDDWCELNFNNPDYQKEMEALQRLDHESMGELWKEVHLDKINCGEE